MAVDFEHTSQDEGRRGTKAIQLARYLWDRVVPRPTCCHYGRNSFADLRGGRAFIRHVGRRPVMAQRFCRSRRRGGRGRILSIPLLLARA